MEISFIGSGNVATHLAKACFEKGITIKEIYSKSIENAKVLADLCNAKPIDNLNELSSDVALIVISVSDNALPDVISKIDNVKASIVHTSGSTSIDILKSNNHDYGVIYPLQTFSKNKDVKIDDIPFFIEASNGSLQLALKLF